MDKDKIITVITALVFGSLALAFAALVLALGLGGAWRIFAFIAGFGL